MLLSEFRKEVSQRISTVVQLVTEANLNGTCHLFVNLYGHVGEIEVYGYKNWSSEVNARDYFESVYYDGRYDYCDNFEARLDTDQVHLSVLNRLDDMIDNLKEFITVAQDEKETQHEVY